MSRRSSEVDPLDTSTNISIHDDHDMAGGSQLPPVHIARTRSNTGGNRSRSSSVKLINSAFGRQEVPEEDEESEETAKDTATYRGVDKNYTILEHPDESEISEQEQKTEQVSSGDTSDGRFEEKNDGKVEDGAAGEKIDKKEKRKRKHATIKKVCLMIGKVYVLIFALFLGILGIYWGSLYNRASYYHKINYLVVIGETNKGSIPPLFSATLTNILESAQMKQYGTWHIKNQTDFLSLATSHNNTIREEVIRQIHHQKYWGGIYVPQDITSNYYQALKTGDNFTDSIEFIYESGRNPQGVPSYVLNIIQSLEKQFVSIGSTSIINNLISELSNDEVSNLLTSNPQLLSSLWWSYFDNRPVFGSIVLGVVQIGLLYLLVLSFHQFNFAASTHQLIAKKLHTRQYLLYHMIASQSAYLVMSLVYSLMTLAFQIPVNATFGRSGFLVEWAFVFLTMSALGSINENAAIQIFARYRPAIGFWIVFYMVTNVSVIFSPLVVMNNFFRYGYAMPMYQGNELLKVVFLNTYKGNMGRNIGILIAWIVIMNIILPFNLRNVKKYVRNVEAKAKAALEKSKEEK